MVYSYFTAEEVDDCEPVRKKPRLDIDRDSAMGLSIFTGGKSTTLSEVSLFQPLLQMHSYITVMWLHYFLLH